MLPSCLIALPPALPHNSLVTSDFLILCVPLFFFHVFNWVKYFGLNEKRAASFHSTSGRRSFPSKIRRESSRSNDAGRRRSNACSIVWNRCRRIMNVSGNNRGCGMIIVAGALSYRPPSSRAKIDQPVNNLFGCDAEQRFPTVEPRDIFAG